MDNINAAIGARLKALRQKRGLTLDEFSKLTGVSASMLCAIERGQKSPTLTVLNKINSGLKISLSELFEERKQEDRRVIKKRDMKAVRLKKNSALYMMVEPDNRVEVMRQELAPHTRWDSEGHSRGQIWEYCLPVNGDLIMSVGGERYTVEEGDVFCFLADQDHSYINESDEPLIAILITAYR